MGLDTLGIQLKFCDSRTPVSVSRKNEFCKAYFLTRF